jgi:catechol 2,3-dioxygenase-like lactoylglutathione lyase family enzyme
MLGMVQMPDTQDAISHEEDDERRVHMPTVSIDHIAMPTANAERLLAFYKRLGFPINNEEAWRQGKVPTFSIQVGESKINVHPEGYTASLRGPTAVPGCTDICFVFEGTVEECQKMLQEAGVTIIQGPVPRAGGRGRGTAPSLSFYARDPDDNLLEWMVYQDTPAAQP